jgi:hypothetical protein
MTSEAKKHRDEGTALADALADMVFDRRISGIELANRLGKSEASISCILSPAHDAQFTVRDLPVLLRVLDGVGILKAICSWLNMVPVELPSGSLKHGHVMFEVGKLLTVISSSIDDGKLTIQEAQAIKNVMLDVIGAVDTLVGRKVDAL